MQAGRRVASFSIDTERPFPGADEGVYVFLELLDKLSIPATFFVVGKVGEDRPDIVDAIHKAGHEIACHAWEHPNIAEAPDRRMRFVDELSVDELAVHCGRCVEALTRDGVTPRGFRAPWFRLRQDNLETLARYFVYDSSLTARRAQSMALPDDLAELPVSTLGWRGPRLGTPFLFGPGAMTITRHLAAMAAGNPLVIYAHSFDLMPCPGGLYTNAWKRAWYFDRCGPKRADEFAAFLAWLRDGLGYEFVRGSDLLGNVPEAGVAAEA